MVPWRIVVLGTDRTSILCIQLGSDKLFLENIFATQSFSISKIIRDFKIVNYEKIFKIDVLSVFDLSDIGERQAFFKPGSASSLRPKKD
jgi:hypothetical protein